MSQGGPLNYAFSYTHINTNTTTSIKTSAGILNSICINNPGSAWVVTVNDGANPIAIITPSTGQDSMVYECSFINGLSVVTTGTTPGSITVNWQ